MTPIRPPAVQGRFYPADPIALRAEVDEYLNEVPRRNLNPIAVIVPHAGYAYSGRCAAAVFGRLAPPVVAVVVGPNHTGMCGSPGASLWAAGAFHTPLGAVPVDAELAGVIADVCPLVSHDPFAHHAEHAIEVELPFLQVVSPTVRLVPIVLAFDDWTSCRQLAHGIQSAVREDGRNVLLVASTDMTHYEPADQAERKDRTALQAIERLDAESLLAVCRRDRITMCGRAPTAVVLEAARLLGASRALVVDYRHSGWVTGDDRSVVAYAGVLVS